MPFIKIMVHLVFSTKSRKPLITKELKPLLLEHIKQNSIVKEIYIDRLNCVEDHIHLLISLGADQSIARVAMLLKGESSFWVNKQKLISQKFEWQGEYYAASINKSDIHRVREYIDNQEEHHQHKTFQREYDEFMTEHAFKTNFV